MTRTIVYSLVIVGCVVVGVVVAGPAASTSPPNRLETLSAPAVQVDELPAPAPLPSSVESAPAPSSVQTTSTTAPPITAPEPAAASSTTAAGEDHDHEHGHADDATDIDVAVLVVLAGTSDRYDTPQFARGYYFHQLATSKVVEAFGSLTDTERADRVVKMSTLTSEPATSHGDDASLLVVHVTVEITTFSATAERATVEYDVTATVDTNTSRVVDVELSEV